VFGGRDLLECCSVNDDVDSLGDPPQTFAIAHIAEDVTNDTIAERLLHLVLFLFVPGENDETLRLELRHHRAYERLPKRAGPSGNKDRLAV